MSLELNERVSVHEPSHPLYAHMGTYVGMSRNGKAVVKYGSETHFVEPRLLRAYFTPEPKAKKGQFWQVAGVGKAEVLYRRDEVSYRMRRGSELFDAHTDDLISRIEEESRA